MPIKVQLIGADALEKVGRLSTENRKSLMDSLVSESTAFGLDAVAIAKKEYLTGPRPEKLGVGTGRLRSSITAKTERSGDVITTSVGSNVDYAPIHEFGGATHPMVTDRMRKFSWAMFFKTHDEKWKGLALTNKSRLTIKIPARPYLRPSIQDALPSFQKNIVALLGKLEFI